MSYWLTTRSKYTHSLRHAAAITPGGLVATVVDGRKYGLRG